MKKKERKILRIYKNYFFFSFNFNQCCIINNNHEEIRKVLPASNRRKTIFFSRMKEKIYIYITICILSFPFLFFIVTLKKDETFSYTYTYKYTHPFIFECNFTQADILNFRVSLICCNNEIIERIKHFDYFI